MIMILNGNEGLIYIMMDGLIWLYMLIKYGMNCISNEFIIIW